MKESFAGDLYEEPMIMVPYPSPTNADAHNLQPFFERISTAIRAVDEQVRLMAVAPLLRRDCMLIATDGRCSSSSS